MARALSQAEQFRIARESFVLSRELGCTPAQAAREIELRAIEKRIADERRSLVRPRAAQALPERSAPDFWWKRD